MSDPVYHFTDTCRLPWILTTGELRCSDNSIANFPKDFLWATTDPRGDRTSSALAQQVGYRKGLVQLIRFTLPGEEFIYWREVIARFPTWTDRHVEMLLRQAHRVGVSEKAWRCRDEALSLSKATAVHAKSYLGGRWMRIDTTSITADPDDPDTLGFPIGEHIYWSTRIRMSGGATGYVNPERLERPARFEPEATISVVMRDPGRRLRHEKHLARLPRLSSPRCP